MAGMFEELLVSFKDLGKVTLERNKERSAVKMIQSTVKTLETVLKAMDAFLQKKGVNVSDLYAKGKAQGTSLLGRAKAFLDESRTQGIGSTVKGRVADLRGKLSDKYKAFSDRMTGPPAPGEQPVNPVASRLFTQFNEQSKSLLGGLQSLREKVAGAGEAQAAPKTSLWDRLAHRQDRRKKEVEEEKKAVQDRAKQGKKSSWLGKILAGMMGLAGTVVSGVWKATKFLGGFAVRGIGKALFGLVPQLSGSIAKGLSGVIGSLLKGGAGVAWAGIKALPGAVGSVLTSGAVKSGAMMLGRAALTLATGPVGWVVAAGTAAYAGYKLYKYLTRNNVASDVYGKLTLLRLYLYGFNETNKTYFSKLFDLEMLMKDFVKYRERRVEITRLDRAAIDKVLEIFQVQREDKVKYGILNQWFMKRFIPAYKAFMDALYSVNSAVYLDSLDSLKPVQLQDLMGKLQIPNGIYDITQIPVHETSQSFVTKADVESILANITNDIKSKLPQQKTLAQQAKEQNAKPTPEVATTLQRPPVEPPAVVKPPAPRAQVPETPHQEGEARPKEQGSLASVSSKAAGKLNVASGQLLPGGTSLEGITARVDKTKIYNLDPNLRELFTGMAKEYHNLTGKTIPVNEAFRSYEDQVAMKKKYPDLAAKPGTSLHEYGLAVDVDSAAVAELDKLGLLRKYGFTAPVGGEKWHLEPIGVSMDPGRAKKEANFRASAILASPGNGGAGYAFEDKSNKGRRDLELQRSIYNSHSDNPIDLTRVAQKTPEGTFPPQRPGRTPAPAPSTPSPPTDSGAKILTASAIPTEGEKAPTATSQRPTLGTPRSTPSLDTPAKGIGTEPNPHADIGKYADLSPEQAIKQASKMTNVNESTMMTFAKLESGLNPNAKAPTSSATGLFQIVDSTWKELLDKHGDKYNIPADADRTNPYYNSLMAGEYMKSNLKTVANYKQTDISEPTAAYLAHFLGPGGARKLIDTYAKAPEAPVKTAVSGNAYSANKSLLQDKTVDQFVDTIDAKIATAQGTPSDAYKASKSAKSAPTSQPSISPTAGSPSASTVSVAGSSYTAASPVVDTPTAPKPAISTTRYDVTASKPTPAANSTPSREIPTPAPLQSMFSTGKMEGLLNDQLQTLVQIAGILTSMNEKFDLGKLKEALSAPPPGGGSTPPPPMDKSIPPNSINLSRKKLML